MARPRCITQEQTEAVIRLYRAQKLTIKQIMDETGVKSEQTIYRILDENGIPRLQQREMVRKASISFDADTWVIIERKAPKNLSKFICDLIKGCH